MSTIQEAIKSVQNYGNNFTKALERHRGFLGNGEGTVYVADRDGYVYVRNRQAESTAITGTMEPEEVIYARSDIPPIEGYPVIFGRDIDTDDFQLLATDSSQLLGWIFDKYIKDHHEQHEFNEYDTVWIQKQAMLPLLVYPTDPVSTTLNVHQGWYQWDTDWHFFETTTSSELSSYIPTTSGKARFLLICIDGETETLYYESGDTFIIFLPPRDCEDRIPAPPEGKIPLAAIYLPYGTTSFDWDIIYDVRILFSGGGSMSTGSAPRTASYVTLGLDATLSAERVLTAAAGITVVDNGAGSTVEVGLDDHDHAGLVGGDGGILPGTSVELPEIGTAIYDDVTDWFNTTQSAGRLSGGTITDNGDGTIDVAAGTGYIKVADANLSNTLFFDWPATAAPLTPTDQAKNWVYVDYNGGTPVVGITDDETTISRNDMFYIARLWRDGNDLHIVNHGQSAYNLSMRTDRYLADVFHNIRSSGQVTAEKNERYLTVTAGIMFHGLSLFETAAIDTSLTGAGDIFTYYYRDGAAGWTTGTASQIDNVNYDDGTGVLEPVTVKQYGVFWVYLCHESRLYVQYGQDSYKLAAAQESQVPVPPPFLAGFANLIARVIVQRNAANLEEIAYPWDEIFMPQAATDHNQLGNLQGGAVDEYYHIDLNAYEQLSGGGAGVLPNVGAEGYALVSTGVNTWGADDTPLWKGRHSFEAGITFAGGAGVNSVVIPDGLADAFDITNGVEFLRLNTDANYFLVDPALAGIKFGLGTAAPAANAHMYSTADSTIALAIDCQGDTGDQQASLHLLTLGDGTKTIGDAATNGWEIGGRGNAWTTVAHQNDLIFSFWTGAAFHVGASIDPTGVASFYNGIILGGATTVNIITIPDNIADAISIEDGGGLEYLRINSENANPYFLIDPGAAGVNVGIGIAAPGNTHLYVYDNTLTSVTHFYGIRSYHIKTGGAGGAGNDYWGIHSHIELNQNTTIDNMQSLYMLSKLTLGTADTVYGFYADAEVAGGTVNASVRGGQGRANIDGGTINGTVMGGSFLVDIEGAATVNGNIYGLYISVADGDDTSTSYMLYLDEVLNVDYGIYQNGGADNRLGGDLTIVPLATGGADEAVFVDTNGKLIPDPSDARFKRNVEAIDGAEALAAIQGLRGVFYDWNGLVSEIGSFGDRRQVGLIAQEVEPYIPLAVSETLNGWKSLSTKKIVAYLIEAIKAQQTQIAALQGG